MLETTFTVQEASKVSNNILEKGKTEAIKKGIKNDFEIERYAHNYLQGELEMILIFGGRYASKFHDG